MKTRIKVVDGVYYPEYRSWGVWFGIVVGHSNIYGNSYHYTGVSAAAKTAIDRHLKKYKEKVKVTGIIEYPLND